MNDISSSLLHTNKQRNTYEHRLEKTRTATVRKVAENDRNSGPHPNNYQYNNYDSLHHLSMYKTCKSTTNGKAMEDPFSKDCECDLVELNICQPYQSNDEYRKE